MRIRAELLATGKNTAGFEIPDATVEALGGGGRPKVRVVVDGYEFRTSIAKMGGRYLLGVSSERRAEGGIAAGGTYDIDLTLDTDERTAEVPADLAAAFAERPEAQAFFAGLSFSKQQWHVTQVTSAKQPETRARRVATSVAMLAEGRAR